MVIEIELKDVFDKADKINYLNDGEKECYYAGDERFEEVLLSFKEMIENARQMPAFGVSLNNETLKVINSGVWVEFDFGKTYESSGMPYEKLLINVNKSWQAFNLIRYNSSCGYAGRCFHYALVGNDMSNFYDILLKN